MMIPVARRRRVTGNQHHHHETNSRRPPDPQSATAQWELPFLLPSATDGSALAARLSLQEKLRSLAETPASASCFSFFGNRGHLDDPGERSRRHVDDPGERSRRTTTPRETNAIVTTVNDLGERSRRHVDDPGERSRRHDPEERSRRHVDDPEERSRRTTVPRETNATMTTVNDPGARSRLTFVPRETNTAVTTVNDPRERSRRHDPGERSRRDVDEPGERSRCHVDDPEERSRHTPPPRETNATVTTVNPTRPRGNVVLSTADICVVCLDEVQANQRVTKLPCSHKFHSDCVLPWLAAHSQCPCCRTNVPS